MNSKIVFTLFFSFFLMGLTISLKAQTDAKQQSSEEKERLELSRKVQQGLQARSNNERLQSKSALVQTNKYNHLEAEIMSKLNTEGIPADFPVLSGYSNEQYTILMNKWYSANPALLKKESNTNEQK